jgi:agmatine deiminase
MEMRETLLPAEWYPQSGVMLTWPHEDTDWHDMLQEVTTTYLRMAYEIASRETLIIVTPHKEKLLRLLTEQLPQRVVNNIRIVQAPTNDTWARDHGFITLSSESGPRLLDFCFNGWGDKFPHSLDNRINSALYEQGAVRGEYTDCLDFVLEGGSIESDGTGTLMTTTSCLMNPNRNGSLSKDDIENVLRKRLHIARILWLDRGYLAGDDTEGHIDTLARFCPGGRIAYVRTNDQKDEHYEELKAMEQQLTTFVDSENKPYKLVPLPMPDAIVEDGERLPATYANFLIMNKAVLVPSYAQPGKDEEARRIIQNIFPKHEAISVDCRPLIRQHGSLHCCTMQFPAGVVKPLKKES